MPISTTVSMRRYNKEVMLSAGLRAELESSQESIKLAKKKNRDLRQQLKVAVVDAQDLATYQERLSLEKAKNAQLTKRLNALSAQDQELASCRKSLQIEKEKTLKLKTRLKTVSDPGERELNAVRSKCRAEFKAALNETVQAHAVEFKKMEVDLRDQVKRLSDSMKELKSINDKLMRENERLRHQCDDDVKIPASYERVEEALRLSKNIHIKTGGRAGSG